MKIYNYDVDVIKTNIKSFMKDRNISQAMLAGAIGVSQARVSACLKSSGKDIFSFEQMVNIANVLEIPIDEIIGGGPSHSSYSMYSFFENAVINQPSLADFAALFFNLYLEMNITIEEEDVSFESPEGESFTAKEMSVRFHYTEIEDFLYLFKKVAEASMQSEMGDKLLRIWVEEYIKERKNITLDGFKCSALAKPTMELTDTYLNVNLVRRRNTDKVNPDRAKKLPKNHIVNSSTYNFKDPCNDVDFDAPFREARERAMKELLAEEKSDCQNNNGEQVE